MTYSLGFVYNLSMILFPRLIDTRSRFTDEVLDIVCMVILYLSPIMVIMSANFKSYSSVQRIVRLILNQRKEIDDALSDFTNDQSDCQSKDDPRYTAILRNLDLLSSPTSESSFIENTKF